jgi:hypothetical protein
VEGKIPAASATELERLAGALESVVGAERTLLELTPRTAKNKAPSLRPRKPEIGSLEWQREFDRQFERLNGPVIPIGPDQPTAPDPSQTPS